MQKINIKSTLLILTIVSLTTLIIVQAPMQSFADVPSPKKQTKIGIDETDIICKANLVKVYRPSTDSINCFKISSIQKLADRGLIEDIPKDNLELKESFRQSESIGTITKVATLKQFADEGTFSTTFRVTEYLHVFEVCAKDKDIIAPEILLTSDSEANTVKLSQKISANKCYTTAAKIKATDPSSVTTSLTNKGMITDKLTELRNNITDIKEKLNIVKKELSGVIDQDAMEIDEDGEKQISSTANGINQLRKELNQAKGELNKYLFALHVPPQLKSSDFTKQKLTFTGIPLDGTSANIMTITKQVSGTRDQTSMTGDTVLYNVVFEVCTGNEPLRAPEVRITSDSDEKVIRIAEKVIPNSCQMSTAKINAIDSISISLEVANRADISSKIVDLEEKIGMLVEEQTKYQNALNKFVVQSEKPADYEEKISEISNKIIQLRNEIKDAKFQLYGSIYEIYKNP